MTGYPQYPQDNLHNMWINSGTCDLSFWLVYASIRVVAKDDITMVSYTLPDSNRIRFGCELLRSWGLRQRGHPCGFPIIHFLIMGFFARLSGLSERRFLIIRTILCVLLPRKIL